MAPPGLFLGAFFIHRWLASISQADAPTKGVKLLPLTPATTIRCERLGVSGLRAIDCVRRIVWAKRRRTQQVSRGQSYDCDSCPQGRSIKAALGKVFCRAGNGPGNRFDPSRDDAVAQYEAQKRQARAGLLSPVKSMDEPRGEEDDAEAEEDEAEE